MTGIRDLLDCKRVAMTPPDRSPSTTVHDLEDSKAVALARQRRVRRHPGAAERLRRA